MRVKHPALMSDSQLASFRSQIEADEAGAFLSSQLLEKVSLLNTELRAALRRVRVFESAAITLLNALDRHGEPPNRCPRCGDRKLRTIVRRLALLAGADPASPRSECPPSS